ncbi:MAG: ABC transporter permease [Halobacteria archaeon]|nr:ABC transporter permease [Halobacteria archaeon]
MSTETETQTDAEGTGRVEQRGFIERFLASPFLSDLLSNRLAVIGLFIITVVVITAIGSRILLDIEQLQATKLGSQPFLAPPSLEYPFGTDIQARNIFLRVLYGSWLALKYGTVIVAASTVLGVSLGIVASYYGDITDNVIMRTMDVLLAFPSLLLALALVAIFGAGLWKAVLALTLVYTPRFARVVRGAALKVLEDEYIDATEALGARDPRILAYHILPNTLAPVTVQSTLNFGLALIDLAALSFLGFGASPGTPSWGMMLQNGVKNGLLTGKWWWSFFPGLALALTVLGFNLLGDGMRDALDPRMREAVE